MIELLQNDCISRQTLLNYFNSLSEFNISLNSEIIKKDIDKIQEYKLKPYNKKDKTNLIRIEQYLTKLYDRVLKEPTIEMCWKHKKELGYSELPETYPIKLLTIKEYGINTSDYIETDNAKVLTIDTSDLADVIAFELMHKDLGETHDTIEKLLDTVGIINYYPIETLTSYFKENNEKIFNLSHSLKIESTPYWNYDKNKVSDYFHTIEVNTKEYSGIVDYSCTYANLLITYDILNKAAIKKIQCNAVAINPINITLLINSDNDDIDLKNELVDDISIRSFGRKFKLNRENIRLF